MTAIILSTEQAIHDNREYLESLWWLMHHSEDNDRRATVAFTCYCDDSGTDGESAVTVLGGMVTTRDHFLAFDAEWRPLLRRYGIRGPLHMKEFANTGLRPEMKVALLSDVAVIINKHKLFSLSVGIPQKYFHAASPQGTKKQLMSPYGFAFFSAVLINRSVSNLVNTARMKISYLVDSGSAGAAQLVDAHAVLSQIDDNSDIGAMAFDNDENVSALQAADVIAWSARHDQTDGLKNEYAPLKTVLNPDMSRSPVWQGIHQHLQMPPDGIDMFAQPIHNWLRLKGRFPKIEEMLR